MADPLKIMPIQKVGAVSHCMGSPASYASEAGRWRTPTKAEVAAIALRKLEEARAKDVAVHEDNQPAILANTAVRAKVEALMAEIGMPVKFSEVDSRSRARFPKRVTQDAGWVADLRRECPIQDGFIAATDTYRRLKTSYEAYAAEGAREAEQAAAAKAQEDDRRRQEKLANVELAEIILRHGLDRESEWDDVLGALREKNQRLDLAVAMLQTRSDWSDGPDRVIDALRGFKIETTEDKDIVTDVMPHATDWDGDGRIFRDCSWNYSRLFAEAADQQLSSDIQKAMERSARD